MKVLFLHGLESLPGGSKVKFLEDSGYEVINPLLPKHSWEDSVDIAQTLIDSEKPGVIVGSSRGGAVALNVNPYGARLVLIAPAWKTFGANLEFFDSSTIIIHCSEDKIVDYYDSETLQNATGGTLVTCGEDHRMNDPAALEAILAAVKQCAPS